MYGLKLLSGGSSGMITVGDLKAWLRQDQAADDTLVMGLGDAATGTVERLIGRQLVTAQWVMTLDGFPYPGGWQALESPGVWPDPHTILIPKAPLQSVESIQFYDYGGTLRTLDAAVYDVDPAHDPGRVTL